ncbi:MAG: aminotransferase class I/II-fold pyridoxal phosphate-dependent enzyme [Solirubrobacteraceae bacterium]|nr:aminotransferase class I/II-fold pyridoxal phosphate-dependent enzyme [Solirubrobacteraceae bacterium]
MGLLDRYRRFEELPDEEVSARLRAQADERRRTALARIERLDLSRTTWPEYPPAAVVGAIAHAARSGLQRYTGQSGELRARIGERHSVPPERVAVGHGASQLLGAAVQALCEPGDELLTHRPSYPLYPILAARARARPVTVRGMRAKALLDKVTSRTRVLVLCNPNDPTGELMAVDELRALAEALPERVVVLLDEALRDFVDAERRDAALELCASHPRLLAFRSFSKAWGLAGLRCGYAVGGPGSEWLLERLGPPLGIGELAQVGALEALQSAERIVARRVAHVASERERLHRTLRELSLEALPSQASFLWIAAPGLEGAELAARLRRRGIDVAPGGPLGDLRHVRAAVIGDEQTDRLLRALTAELG